MVLLILAACGYGLRLWTEGQVGPGAVAAVTAMALRISGITPAAALNRKSIGNRTITRAASRVGNACTRAETRWAKSRSAASGATCS